MALIRTITKPFNHRSCRARDSSPSRGPKCLSRSKSGSQSPKTVNKGLFSKKYTSFKVSTSPHGIEVERRYNDFFWLRNSLQRDHPGVYIAPMDKKTSKQNKFDTSFLKKRIFNLQEFMNSICQHPELREDPHLHAFLTIVKEADFEKQKKELDKVQNPNSSILGQGLTKKQFYLKNPIKVDHLITSTGQAECKINGEIKNLYSNLHKVLRDWIPEYNKAKDLVKQYIGALDTTKDIASKLSQSVAQLQASTNKFNEQLGKENASNWTSMEHMYGHLSETLKHHSRF